MGKIQQLSPHLANLIAAGEVVERPASVVKELLENAVDAGAHQVVVELREGGMVFLRVTDDGCGMAPQDAQTAFLRHATSKLRTEQDLGAIGTMGFRGEALAAIASVSRVDLLTRTPDAIEGTSLHLEGGVITDRSEAGCPQGTTIIVRDLFYNTPARMKFMKSDSVEGAAAASAVQRQALAHPEVAFRCIRDGKEILNTPGDGKLSSVAYGLYGKDAVAMAEVDSHWEKTHVYGLVTKPTQARPSRAMQSFFVNGRPVKSKLLVAALEEAYRNRIMVGKFPGCILHITLPVHTVDVNVHPAKTEIKFLQERAVFDCVHYGVLAALNKQTDRPEVAFKKPPVMPEPAKTEPPKAEIPKKKEDFYKTMSAEEFTAFAKVVAQAPQPEPKKALETVQALPLRQTVQVPQVKSPTAPAKPVEKEPPKLPPLPPLPAEEPKPAQQTMELPQQKEVPLPEPDWRMVGEAFDSYIIVEQGDTLIFIDKHAAHERINFERLRAQHQGVTAQTLLSPAVCRLDPEAAAAVLGEGELLQSLGFEAEAFGTGVLLLRTLPMDLDAGQAEEVLTELSQSILRGKNTPPQTLRDELLHTVACKSAIKAGWHTNPQELRSLAAKVLVDESLQYCPHGRPICTRLPKKQLERQFGRT